MRGHQAISITEFNGLWARGEIDRVPQDHFSIAHNIQYIDGGFKTRDGVSPYQTLAQPLGNILKVRNYKTPDGDSLLVLIEGGDLYHVVDATSSPFLVLSIAQMTDFGLEVIAGRAFISPFRTFIDDKGIEYQTGIENEFLYVYVGDSTTPARKAAGAGPPMTPALTAANSGGVGFTDPGLHVFGVLFETNTGFLTAPGALTTLTTLDNESVNFSDIPVSANPDVVARHIVASRTIANYNGIPTDYQVFFLRRISNNTDTTLNNVSFFDAELIADASHLYDNFSEIPAGVRLTTYHGRLVLTTTFEDISVVYLSHPGEPEAIDQVDGVLIAPRDGNPITSAQEFRDILYVFKKNRTFAYSDNGSFPSTWPMTVVDQGIGSSVHGVATVLESGGVNAEFLIISGLAGVFLFNGFYSRPELSYKILNIWQSFAENDFTDIQVVNNTIDQFILILLENGSILYGNYEQGLSPQSIKWAIWTFDFYPSFICITETKKVIIGAGNTAPGPVPPDDDWWDMEIVKQTNQNHDTNVLVNDIELHFPVLANHVYLIEAYLIISCNTSSNFFSFSFSYPEVAKFGSNAYGTVGYRANYDGELQGYQGDDFNTFPVSIGGDALTPQTVATLKFTLCPIQSGDVNLRYKLDDPNTNGDEIIVYAGSRILVKDLSDIS